MPLPSANQLNNNETNRVLEEIRALRKRIEQLERRPAAKTNFANASTTNVIVGIGDPFDSNNPFTGTAILYPAYASPIGNLHAFGMKNGVVQWGANSDDGKIYFGGGDGWLDEFGLTFENQQGFVQFLDTLGGGTMLLYSDGADWLILENSFGGKGISMLIDDVSHNVNQIDFDSDGNIYLHDGSIDLAVGTYQLSGTDITKGWIPVIETWTRTGNHQFTVAGDLTTKYRKSTKILYNDGATEFGVVGSSSHVAGTTTVNLIPNTDYLMAAATITDKFISYIESPEGFPYEFSFTPTWSAGLTPGSGTNTGKWNYQNGIMKFRINFVYGAGSSVGLATLLFPLTTATYGSITPVGLCRYKDATGGNAATGLILSNGVLVVVNSSGTYGLGDPLSSTVPFTWATSDELTIEGSYFA